MRQSDLGSSQRSPCRVFTISVTLALGNFYLSTWEEYHTGTLYLSAFSGPVEGIIIIVLLYVITGFTGTPFWLQTIRTTLGLSSDVLTFIPDMQVNHFLIAIGAIGLGGNILTAYVTIRGFKSSNPSATMTPLLRVGNLNTFLTFTVFALKTDSNMWSRRAGTRICLSFLLWSVWLHSLACPQSPTFGWMPHLTLSLSTWFLGSFTLASRSDTQLAS